MIWKHKKLGEWKVVEELTQAQTETIFQTHYSLPEQSPIINNRLMVEAGIEAGLFTDNIDIAALKPAEIVWLSKKIISYAVDAITVPEEEAKN